MSMDSAGIYCTGCNFQSREVYQPILLRYVRADGKTIETGRTKGWCYHCSDYADIEDTDLASLQAKLQQYRQQATTLQQQLAQLQRGFLARLRHGFKISDTRWSLEQAQQKQAKIELLLEFFQQRVAKPRCLKCFSEQTAPLSFHRQSYLSENFTHHCGGQLRVAHFDMELRIHFRLKVLVLNSEGELLHQE